KIGVYYKSRLRRDGSVLEALKKSKAMKVGGTQKEKGMSRKGKDRLFIAVCVLPAVLLFSLFILYPMAKGFMMSFYRYSGLGGEATFIGLKNFQTLFADPIFLTAMKNMVFVLVFFPLMTMVLAMLFAVMLTQGRLHQFEQKFFKMIIFFPNILSMVVIGVLFLYLYDYNLGLLNGFLDVVGFEVLKQTWLGQKSTVLWCLVATMVWQATGYYMVMYIAGINQIPVDLYEAADIDGASKRVQFFKITLPLLWQILRVTLVFFITGAFNLTFTFVTVMTSGGPNNASQVPLTYMYSQAFSNANYGYAMAIAVVVFILAITLSFMIQKLTDKDAIEF
ncbi:MAG: carbohydrate ABC transporter permease, partial [Turicibacter sanguinis]